jgi:fibronectin-binding autotransporter adhesin
MGIVMTCVNISITQGDASEGIIEVSDATVTDFVSLTQGNGSGDLDTSSGSIVGGSVTITQDSSGGGNGNVGAGGGPGAVFTDIVNSDRVTGWRRRVGASETDDNASVSGSTVSGAVSITQGSGENGGAGGAGAEFTDGGQFSKFQHGHRRLHGSWWRRH